MRPSPSAAALVALALALPLAITACGSTSSDAPRAPRPPRASSAEGDGANAPAQETASEPAATPAVANAAEPAAPVPAPAPKPEPPRADAPPMPKNTAVLHVGDSMVESGLAQALRPRMRALGVRYEVRGEQSTFTQTWAGRMDELVAATQPDLVIITLGGNEIGNTRPETSARFVKRIVNATKGRPCVWMTAPLWREETGIYDVIQKNAAPCRFFETDRFLTEPIERRGDKIHPTPKGGEMWAGVFWGWLMGERTGATKPWDLRAGPDAEYAPRGIRTAPTFPLPGESTASR
jgi:hypothetical protein